MMTEILEYSFMQRALLSAILIGTLCSVIGVYVVLRGIAFIGAGTAHAAFAGVTLGFLIDTSPLVFAILFGLATIWITQYLSQRGDVKLDASIGVFYAFTMALAIFFLGLMRIYNAEVYGYLFGSILSVTPQDLWIISGLTLFVLLLIFTFYKELHFLTFDQEMAEASGIPAKMLFFLLLNLIALTIVVSLKAVGALLVFALIIIPAATAYQFSHSMRWMMVYSVGVGITASVGGVLLSYQFDLPSGATIVLLATALFFLSVIFSPKRRKKITLPA
jgi:ABC-type Mn2+/Zn2+ transport system permease subunit